MRFQLSTSFVLSLLLSSVAASDFHNRHHRAIAHKRQDPSPPPPPPATPPPASSPPPNTPPPQPQPTPPANSPPPPPPAPSAPPSVSVGPSGGPLQPTSSVPVYTRGADGIMPLPGIVSGMPPGPILPVTATFSEGSKPSNIPSHPGLPKQFVFTPGAWPPSDRIVPTDSAEVRAWMKELDGWDIPDLNPTIEKAECAANPAEEADAANRGWWTCGGYTRATDIVACPTKYDWGVSFDDGPTAYTPTLLKYLKDNSLKSTFFVVGSRVIASPNILVQAFMEGHEISVHTWSHFPLTTLTNEQIVGELGWSRKVIREVLGVTPTTMRPPYGDIDDRVRAIAMAMGLNPIMWTATPSGGKFDTNDWRVAGGFVTGQQSFDTFQSIMGNASLLDTGFIVLQHDLFEQCVELATGYTLKAALAHNPRFNLKTIGQCMNLAPTTLYMETNTDNNFPNIPKAAAKSNTASPGVKGIDADGDGKIDTKSGQTANGAHFVQVHTGYLAVLGAIAFFASLL